MISPARRWLTPVVLLVALTLLVSACSRNSDSSANATVTAEPAVSATSPSSAAGHGEASPTLSGGTPSSAVTGTLSGAVVTIPDLRANPDDYSGATVLSHGYVDLILSANAVVLVDASEQLLVLGTDGALPDGLTVGEFVEVSGTIEPFNVEHAADQLDISLSGLDVARFEGGPSLVVDAIHVGARPVSEVAADAASFEGRTIAVGGQITSVVDARAFVLAPAGGGTPGDELLVATPFAAVPAQMAEQTRVQVVGRVVVLDADAMADLGDEFAFLSGSAFDAWRDKAVFIGDIVDVVAPAPSATVEEILSKPDTWVDKTVTVIDTVAQRLTDRAVSVGADGGLMIVGTPDQLPAAVAPGATVVVNGTVALFDPNNPPDVAGFDPAHPAVAAYAGQPIVVVTSVQVLPGE